ncbi:MAG: M81 family metallopeptidase [bacterium]|nr:M81 family metallopeptidase [bacterium]
MFMAMLSTETNTFSPIPTGPNIWRDMLLVRRSDPPAEAPPLLQAARALIDKRAEERGWENAEGLFAFAQPAGLTPRAYYEELRDDLLSDLRAAMPVDGVLLMLHGAMVAEGYDDCEGDILARVRELVGPDVPVGAELDLHCHVTDRMVEQATALVGYKEYPHVDIMDRMLELFTILADAAEGVVTPVISTFKCRMIGLFPTTREPLRSLVDEFTALEGRDGVLNVWLGHGFPYGDVPDLGSTMVVVTDGDPALGEELAKQMGRKFFELREQVQVPARTLADCLDLAVAASEGPITIADTPDNAGGGAPNDSTFFLAAMLERGIENAAIGPLWDPTAVEICQDAGVGARLSLRIGGKLGPSSGDPVDVVVTVVGLCDELENSLGGVGMSMGAAVGIKVHLPNDSNIAPEAGIDLVLTARRGQGFSPSLFSSVGIDPEQKQILVVKSTQHFHAGFAPISKQVLYAGDLGALPGDMLKIPLERADTSRLWPFVEDPHAD